MINAGNLFEMSGPPLIADVDGDGLPEIGLAGFDRYSILEHDGTVKRQIAVIEDGGSVGSTGSTAFDFEGDGRVEIVYFDSEYLYVWDGETGRNKLLDNGLPYAHGSDTATEFPIVADVDGDGQAEIVAVSSDQRNVRNTPPGLYIIGDADNSWVNARSIWNQHAYNITNVNDDGSIPASPTLPWLDPAINFNGFRANQPGNNDRATAPDLIPSYVRTQQLTDEARYTVRVGNGGSLAAEAGVRVAIFEGDPLNGGSQRAVGVTAALLEVGRYEDVEITVTGAPIADDDLWVFVDWDADDSSIESHGYILECSEANNLYNLGTGLEALPDNANPIITSTAQPTIVAGRIYSYQIEASDPEGHVLRYELADGPEGVVLDSATGELTWETDAADVDGLHQFVIRVRDGRGGFATQVFRVDVEGVNSPPRITSTPPRIAIVGQAYQYSVSAVDPNSDGYYTPFNYEVVVDGVGNIPTINSLGVMTWTPSEAGPANVTVSVSDDRGGRDSQTFVLDVRPASANLPPEITSSPDTVPVVGNLFSYQVVATDDQDQVSDLTYSLAAGSASLGMTLSSDGLLEWTPTAEGIATIQITVTDTDGAYATQALTIDVNGFNPNNRAPRFIPQEIDAFVSDQAWQVTFQAEDADGDPLTLTLVDTNAGVFPPAPYSVQGNEITLEGYVGFQGIDEPETDFIYILLKADDGRGGVTFLSVDVPLVSSLVPGDGGGVNEAPVVQPRTGLIATAGARFEFTPVATDTDGGPITFALLDGANESQAIIDGVQIDPLGRVTWDVPVDADPAVDRIIRVVARDSEGAESDPQTFTIDVQASGADAAPTVSVEASSDQIQSGQTVAFFISPADDNGLTEVYIEIDGPSVSGGPLRIDAGAGYVARYTALPADAGNDLTVRAYAVDNSGQSVVSDPLTVTVAAANTAPPEIRIANLNPGQLVEAPLDVQGAIFDTDSNLVYRAITLKGSNGEVIRQSEQGQFGGVTLIAGLGDGATDVSLETLNPLTLASGEYTLELLAQDTAGSIVSASTPFTIQSSNQVKLGNFALSFTDLSVAVSGIPITVTRSYDTLDADTDGDFGYGWQLDVLTGRATVSNLAPDDFITDDDFLGATFETPWQFGTNLNFELPGGQNLSFTAVPQTYNTGGGAGGQFAAGIIANSADVFAIGFLPEDQDSTGITLELLGGQSIRMDDAIADRAGLERGQAFMSVPVTTNAAGALTTLDRLPFNPATVGWDYRLTMRDGTQYVYESVSGDLLSVTDSSGNTLTPGRDAIVSTSADGIKTARVNIIRDPQGRVTDIVDPDGDTLSYTYSTAGDLESVTDRTGRVTTFDYGQDDFSDGIDVPEHILTSITQYPAAGSVGASVATLLASGGGVDVMQIGFNADGTLKGITDASGASAGFGYNFQGPGGTNIEAVTDADGIFTEIVRDARGNTLRTVQQLSGTVASGTTYLVGVYEYDADDNQTAAYQPFEVTEAAGGDDTRFTIDPTSVAGLPTPTRTTFDRFGNPLTTTDALGNTTTFGYDDAGNPTRIEDALGNVTLNRYDSQNRLTQTVDAEGNITQYGYDSNGNLTTLTQIDETGRTIVQSTFDYDSRGRLISTTGVDPDGDGPQSGITRYFAYDNGAANSDGNQTHSWSFKDNVTTVSVTTYDEESRVTGSSQYTLTGELTSFGAVDTAIAVAGAADWSTSTTYDALGRVKTSTDRFGTVTENFYDVRGNVVETRTETTLANGTDAFVVTRTAYDTNGRAIANSDPLLVSSTGTLIDPTTETDTGVNANTPTGAFLRSTHTLYDDAGRVTETRRVQGIGITITGPDANGLYTTGFDTNYNAARTTAGGALLSATATRYDAAGRVDETQTTEGLITKFVYDNASRQERVIIDPANTFGMFAETVYTYDAASRQETVTDPAGRVTRFVYDNLGRVIQTIQEGNDNDSSTDLVTRTVYDARGRRVAEIDALGRRTDFTYDDAGRLTGVQLPGVDDALTPTPDLVRPSYEYGYDSYGNQTSITDPQGRITTFGFDGQNRQTSRTLPLGVETTTILDDFTESMEYYEGPCGCGKRGLLKSATDFEGNTVTYGYDQYGRAETVTYTDSGGIIQRIVNTTYDGFRRVKQVVDSGNQGNGTTTHVYDAEGRLIERATPQGTLIYEYDPETGRQIAVEGVTTRTEYDYDEQGRLVVIKAVSRLGANPNELTEYVFNRFGELDWEVGPNGVTRDNQYDSLGRLNRIVHFNDTNDDGTRQSGETLIAQFDYTYDASGNRLSSTETIGGLEQVFTYEYDGLNRLTKEALVSTTDPSRNFTTKYKFDLTSNRVQLVKDTGSDGYSGTNGDETIDYVYDANDRLETETSSVDGLTTYGYNNTLQVSKTEANGTITTQTYDVMGRLQTVTIDDGQGSVTTESYTYNTSGIRTSRTVNGVTTVFLYDLQNPTGYAQILEQGIDDGAGGGTAGDGRLHADEVDTAFTLGYDVITQAAVGQVLHLLYDIHGSTRALTDAVGNLAVNDNGTPSDASDDIQQVFTYDAYGKAVSFASAQALTTLLYSGEFTNAITGSQYLRARYYDAATGRFNRLDPYFGNHNNPLSFHKYQYTHGNPIFGIDPTGLTTLLETTTATPQAVLADTVYKSAAIAPAAATAGSTALAIGIVAAGPILVIAGGATIIITNTTRNRRQDACQQAYGLAPAASTARWWTQRPPINGNTTVQAAAFRLDAGFPTASGQRASRQAGRWVRQTVGRSTDQAGHVIGKQFGGSTSFNSSLDGNIFPQDTTINIGRMKGYEVRLANRHRRGEDVCALVSLIYSSPSSTRPDQVLYQAMVRTPGSGLFLPLPAEFFPNP
ncbi:MAG: RHS repeat-associated core domain-containing protein [Planctomycetota bacterium]